MIVIWKTVFWEAILFTRPRLQNLIFCHKGRILQGRVYLRDHYIGSQRETVCGYGLDLSQGVNCCTIPINRINHLWFPRSAERAAAGKRQCATESVIYLAWNKAIYYKTYSNRLSQAVIPHFRTYCWGPNNGNLGARIFLLTWSIWVWEGADTALVPKNSWILGSRMVKGCTSSTDLTIDLRMCIRPLFSLVATSVVIIKTH